MSNKSIVLILFSVLTLIVSGCLVVDSKIQNQKYVGTYQLEGDNDLYKIIIQDDNTFLFIVENKRFSKPDITTEKGVYIVKDGTVQLTRAFGITDVMELNGHDLRDQKGNLWKRVG